MQAGVDYFIEKLSPHHQSNKFSLGPDPDLRPLKSFLQNNAHDYQVANVAVTYVAVLPAADKERPRIIGYVTLTCSEIKMKGAYTLEDCEHAMRYDSMPALKVARLARHHQYKGAGIGEALMEFAIAMAVDHIAHSVGCRFLVTDSKANSVWFYERMGLTLLDTDENKVRKEPLMFLDLNKLIYDDVPEPEIAFLDDSGAETPDALPRD